MMNQYQQKGMLILVGLITLAMSWVYQGEVEKTIFSSFGIIAIIISGVMIVFDRYLWNWKYLYDWFVSAPDLNGKWKGVGQETFTQNNSDGNTTVTNIALNAETVLIEQHYSAIRLTLNWQENNKPSGVTQLDEAAPFVVSGKRTKRLTFNAMYSYTPNDQPAEVRSVIASISMDSKIFHNKPDKFTLTYATTDGSRQGTIVLEPK
jgi:hypothetical protein